MEPKFLVAFSLIFYLQTQLVFPQSVSGDSQDIYYDRPSLLIVLSSDIPKTDSTIQKEILFTVTAAVTGLGSFNIVNFDQKNFFLNANKIPLGTNLDDSILIRIGRLTLATEIMVVEVVKLSQNYLNSAQSGESIITSEQKMTVDSDTIPVELKTRENTKKPGRYFQTECLINIRIIDVVSAQNLETITIEVSHADTSWSASKSGALKILQSLTTSELREIYLLCPEITQIQNTLVQLNRGSEAGIQKGMLFIVRSPDQWEEYYGQSKIIPGKEIGLITTQDISEKRSVATLLRQTGYIGQGFRAFEYPESIYGLRINFSPGLTDSIMSIGAQFFWRPLQRWQYGCGLRVIRITDSKSDKNYGFGMEGLGGVHLYRIPRISVGAIMTLNFDLPFKYDDNNNTVFLPILSGELGMRLNITHFWKTDISIMAGYRISIRDDNWQISSEEEDVGPVYWEDSPPAINISGFFIQAGYTFLLFRR
ncbi:MAG: hypothetical protein JSW33_02345 [bacterium]|nr:MAG: hypothetical protein JSW33_02345 [bacterium]